MPPTGRLRVSVFLAGFTAVTAQVVLMRELMVVFNGNEMSLGLMLAVWLLWSAAGSAWLGRVPLPALQTLIAAGLPFAILAVRAAKALFRTVPGEALGPGPMLLTALAALGLFCAVSGGVFASASRLFPAASVYLLEALGSAAGGALAGLILIRRFTAFEIALGLGMLNLAAAWRRLAPAALALLLAVPFAAPRLEAVSLAWLWRGRRVVEWRNSIYGNLVVTETGGSRTLYENGLPAFTAPDPETAEESVHFALLEHPEPRTALLIGGGAGGSAAEALKHPSLERLDYVELDPTVLDLFPNLPRDPRLHVHAADGRLYLKTCHRRFDVIIVNLPDPATAQLNRFYTLEFFREAAVKLEPGGVLALRLSGAENYISPELADFLRSVRATLGAVYPHVAAIPGGTVHFFASQRPLAGSAEDLLARLRARRIETVYVREYYLPFRMMPDRMREFSRRVTPRSDTPVNRDFAPVAYYFDVTLWSAQFGYASLFRRLASLRFPAVALAVAAAALLLGTAPRPAASTVTMGLTLMGLEVFLLLGFQAVHGYVYHQLAALTAGMMAGMALGSWLAVRKPVLGLRTLMGLAAAAPLVLCASLPHLSPAAFTGAAVLCGIVGGWQFATAWRLLPRPGMLYALDLAGACAGALLVSAWLIPVFGFLKTAVLLAIANAGALIPRIRDS
jgi:spermidine synthase